MNPWPLWFGLQAGHAVCLGTHSAVPISRDGEDILAFAVLRVSLSLSGFLWLRLQNSKRTSKINSVLLGCEFITGV